MTIPEEIEKLKIKLEQTTDEREQAEVLMEILKKYTSINSTDSQPYIDRILQLAEKLSEPFYKAWGWHFRANLIRLKGDYDNSIAFSKQGIGLFEMCNEKKGLASCFNILGVTYGQMNNYSEALENLFTALKIREEIDDKQGIAFSYSNIGIVYFKLGNLPESLKNLFAGLKIREDIGDQSDMASSYSNIGNVYFVQGNYAEALKNHFASLNFHKKNGNKWGIAADYSNIGNVYFVMKDFQESHKNEFASLKIREEIGDKVGLAVAHNNIGNSYNEQGKYSEALNNHFIALNIFKEIGIKSGCAQSYIGIGNAYTSLGNYEEGLRNHLLALKLRQEILEKTHIAVSFHNIGNIYFLMQNYTLALENQFLCIKVGEEIGNKLVVSKAFLSLVFAFKASNDFENALKYYEKYHETEKEMLGEESTKQLNNLSFTHNLEQKEKDLEIEQLRNVELKKERDRSETLLLNILPAEVAEELKAKGSANAKLFDNVTVLFTDFKSFTKVSERLTPQQLVDELNVCFSAFDGIMAKYNIEKIKTVGDAYLAVSGLPVATATHATDVINAAIEIREFIKQRKAEKGEDTFDVRIGVHSGSVVAGIVGVKKFAYDIWGDTVNTAARMEQNSEAGKVNISEATYQLLTANTDRVSNPVSVFQFEYRGEIEAKNKGKMKMYFVESSIV